MAAEIGMSESLDFEDKSLVSLQTAYASGTVLGGRQLYNLPYIRSRVVAML
jgi:hypothetical protein